MSDNNIHVLLEDLRCACAAHLAIRAGVTGSLLSALQLQDAKERLASFPLLEGDAPYLRGFVDWAREAASFHAALVSRNFDRIGHSDAHAGVLYTRALCDAQGFVEGLLSGLKQGVAA